MTEPDDVELLRQYARENSEAAFATLAGRHVHLVYSCESQPLSSLASICEGKLQIPILYQAALTNNFHIELKWQWKKGESENDAFKQAVLDQLGLELVPTNMPIEMLVVEKVKN
jgi:uncharacterized protein (TIGR03435 family)